MAAAAAADGNQQQQEEQVLTSAAFCADAPASLKVAFVTSTDPQVVQVAQVQGDPIFAAAAAAAGGQVQLQVSRYRQLQLPSGFRAAAIAFKPCLSSSRDAILCILSTSSAVGEGGGGGGMGATLSVVSTRSAAGGGGGGMGAAINHEQPQQQQQELRVETYLVPGGAESGKEEAFILGAPSASYTCNPALTPRDISSSSSIESITCSWSPDSSCLAVAGGGLSQVLLLDGEGLQHKPLPGGWGLGTSFARGGSSCAVAAAPSPSSASVAVLYHRMGPGASSSSSSRLAVHGLGLTGRSSSSSTTSSSSSFSELEGGQQIALAGDRVLWCIVTGAHHWDVVQQLGHLGRSVAASQPAAAAPPTTSSSSSKQFTLPAVMAYVDHKLHCHPLASRGMYVSRWDSLKLAVLMMVPGQEAARLAQELYLRGMVLKGLGSLREVLEAAHSELVGGPAGADRAD